MRKLIILAILLTGCATKEVKPELDPAKVQSAFEATAKSFQVIAKQYNDLETRVKLLEEKKK